MANKILVASDTQNRALVRVITRVDTDNKAEVSAYKRFLKTDYPKCPECGKSVDPKPDDMHIIVEDPLQNLFGMEIGWFYPICSHCKKQTKLPEAIDLAAFPATVKFLQNLRAEFNRRRMAAAMKQKDLKSVKGSKSNG